MIMCQANRTCMMMAQGLLAAPANAPTRRPRGESRSTQRSSAALARGPGSGHVGARARGNLSRA